MKLNARKVFPLRLLGFGLYWAWLFLATVSPSPIFGGLNCFGLPAEFTELCCRLLCVIVLFFYSKTASTKTIRLVLLLACCLGGPLSTALLFFFPSGSLMCGAILVMGCADAATFVLWLCFFGHMRVGETALLMALSYCLGGVLCLGIQTLDIQSAATLAMLLPLLSGVAFLYSSKYYSDETGTAELFMEDSSDSEPEKPYPYTKHLGIGLGCVALIFGLNSSSLYYGFAICNVPGVLVESAACIVLALICCVLMFVTHQTQDLFNMYKIVPTIMTIGLILVVSTAYGSISLGTGSTWGVALINLGYLMFEITALNDYCISSRARNIALLRPFCSARISITTGMVAGWLINTVGNTAGIGHPLLLSISVSLVVSVIYPTIIFTEKEIFASRNVAKVQQRIDREIENAEQGAPSTSTFDKDLKNFSSVYQLSEREAEIAAQLLHGRTVNYISEQLFIAPGTVKTHMHNVYTKVDVHSKMELLDAFEEFRKSK